MKNRVATIGLIAFLALDVALVAFALRPGRTANSPQTLPSLSSTTQTSTTQTSAPTTSTASASTSPKPTSSTPPSGAVPVQLLVSALDDQTAWRVRGGSCDGGGASVELTTDGGQTWTKLRSPVRSIARVQALDDNRAFVIGAGADCALRQYATNNAGDSWQAPTPVENGWSRSLEEPTQVVTPKDDKATPCGDDAVLDLSRVSLTQAQALCANGDVSATDDGGSTWSDSGKAPGAVALGNYLEGEVLTTYAVRVVDNCDGLQLVRVVKGRDATVVTCVRAASPKKGQVGLWVSADAGWILSGADSWVGSSDLRTWRKS